MCDWELFEVNDKQTCLFMELLWSTKRKNTSKCELEEKMTQVVGEVFLKIIYIYYNSLKIVLNIYISVIMITLVQLITWAFVYMTFENKSKSYTPAMVAALKIICADVNQHDQSGKDVWNLWV